MIYVAALLAVSTFLVAFQNLRLVEVASNAANVARDAMRTAKSAEMSEDEKELLMQRSSLTLLRAFASISLRGAAALAISTVPMFAMQALGLTTVSQVVALLSTWQAIVVTSVVMTALYFLLPKSKAASLPKGDKQALEDNYSGLDRMIHGLAFSGRAVQITAADMESAFLGERFRGVETRSPIFITSLPRAGTTVLLEVLHHVPSLATHLYRDMPFVFAPMLWDRWSGGFRKRSELIERAHGDGMLVGFDSPEAFEEVIWRMFFSEKFQSDRILLWQDDEDAEEFQEFFVDHMKKIIALRTAHHAAGSSGSGTTTPGRYLSKNNANVSRIGLIKRLFPDSIVLIPFRHPIDQATSLLAQHNKFLKVHAKESFSKRYMHDIGHLEFGELHRPIAFAGMDAVIARYKPDSLDYWVGYWVAAFEQILKQPSSAIFVSYERLCMDTAKTVQALTRVLDLPAGALDTLPDDVLRAPHSYQAKATLQDPELLARAEAVHERLLALSIL